LGLRVPFPFFFYVLALLVFDRRSNSSCPAAGLLHVVCQGAPSRAGGLAMAFASVPCAFCLVVIPSKAKGPTSSGSRQARQGGELCVSQACTTHCTQQAHARAHTTHSLVMPPSEPKPFVLPFGRCPFAASTSSHLLPSFHAWLSCGAPLPSRHAQMHKQTRTRGNTNKS
jgi:hypothetical protein